VSNLPKTNTTDRKTKFCATTARLSFAHDIGSTIHLRHYGATTPAMQHAEIAAPRRSSKTAIHWPPMSQPTRFSIPVRPTRSTALWKSTGSSERSAVASWLQRTQHSASSRFSRKSRCSSRISYLFGGQIWSQRPFNSGNLLRLSLEFAFTSSHHSANDHYSQKKQLIKTKRRKRRSGKRPYEKNQTHSNKLSHQACPCFPQGK